jgi:hypothetical protein
MLINASERVHYHFALWKIVRDLVVSLRDRIPVDGTIKTELEDMWNEETSLVDPTTFGLSKIPFAQIWDELSATIALLGPIDGANHDSHQDCGIVVDNSGAEVRLAYSDETPRPIIVIGGSTLAPRSYTTASCRWAAGSATAGATKTFHECGCSMKYLIDLNSFLV